MGRVTSNHLMADDVRKLTGNATAVSGTVKLRGFSLSTGESVGGK